MRPEPFPLSFYNRPVEQVAPDLLGTLLHTDTGAGRVCGMIVEVEAYGGPDDPASHAAFRKTGYVQFMWGEPGTTYVYTAYGMYPCLNIVTGPTGTASAVLIRAVSVVSPDPDDRSASGPGRLGRTIGLTTAHNGLYVDRSPIWITPGEPATFEIATGPRVGVNRGEPIPWRFAIAGHPAVSRPRL